MKPQANYEHVLEVPDGLRFDTTPETTGKAIEVAFGGVPRSGPAYQSGAPFMRVRNVKTGSVPTFFRLKKDQETDGRAAARAFEGAKANDAEVIHARRRVRCACGKPRRKAASACQSCLDKEDAEARAKEPPTRWARQWRALGWRCVFRDDRVFLRNDRAEANEIYVQPVNKGAWAQHVDLTKPPWRRFEGAEAARVTAFFDLVARDCYCSSFPTTGCDFCNGTRLPDGAKEI